VKGNVRIGTHDSLSNTNRRAIGAVDANADFSNRFSAFTTETPPQVTGNTGSLISVPTKIAGALVLVSSNVKFGGAWTLIKYVRSSWLAKNLTR
jgi:hypothetical protein